MVTSQVYNIADQLNRSWSENASGHIFTRSVSKYISISSNISNRILFYHHLEKNQNLPYVKYIFKKYDDAYENRINLPSKHTWYFC